MIKSADGWAVVQHDVIDMRTVGHTRRMAIVNWLWVEARKRPLATWSDEYIDVVWNQIRDAYNAKVVKVVVVVPTGAEDGGQ